MGEREREREREFSLSVRECNALFQQARIKRNEHSRVHEERDRSIEQQANYIHTEEKQ